MTASELAALPGGVRTEAAHGIEVTVATGAAFAEGLRFCAEKYEAEYGASWISEPDVLFVARRDGRIVATAGLEIGARRPHLDTERYFRLTPGMREFIDRNRGRSGEFGRFSSYDPLAAQAVLHALISYCRQAGIEYLFAWTNPQVYAHGVKRLGVPFWALEVPIDEQEVRGDVHWTRPPLRFFLREDPPRLLLAIIPFFDLVNDRLAATYGRPLDLVPGRRPPVARVPVQRRGPEPLSDGLTG
ncbi:thermostable hemolysin [Streptomyces sp. NPDC001514]